MRKSSVENETKDFLSHFPGHVFRYIDQTGNGRKPFLLSEESDTLNKDGYESYFTVNGFEDFETTKDNKLEHITNLNCFFVDIDGRKDIGEIELIKERLAPTFIVETKRGFHCYWLLDEPIYKKEMGEGEWNRAFSRWEDIEQAIVTQLNADPSVKDATRILRVPNTLYWKKTGDSYKDFDAPEPFRIKVLMSEIANRYSLEQVETAFPTATPPELTNNPLPQTEEDRDEFFRSVNDKYPIETRPSYQALLSGKKHTLPANGSRNVALLVVASLSRVAGVPKSTLCEQIIETGWHGMVGERGGQEEIKTTIDSAYKGNYVYGRKNAYIEHNITNDEKAKMAFVYTAVIKERKELDRVRFHVYEHDIFKRHPNLKRNEGGMVFDYENGVYKMMTRDDMNTMILNSMDADNLWAYRTTASVKDKIMCLLSIIPFFKETNDKGYIVNVKNGLLNILTRELKPHTPSFVTLIQLPVKYDENAQCPNWDKAIDSWTEGEESEEKKLMLQQFTGYCLSSSMKYAKAMFLIGDGGNGKSTYADTVAMLLGHHATSRISLEEIYGQFGLGGLVGKRLNIVEEISANYFQGHKIKALISGEEVSASIKYRDSFKFKPQAKFIFAVNQMPRVDDASSGMERRILAVNFKNNFRDKPNTELRFEGGILSKELSGILNWSLEGAKALHDNKGFVETEEKKGIIQDYREENSSVDGFIADCLDVSPDSVILIPDLYQVYREFCQRDGRTPKAKVGFTKEMKMYSNKTKRFIVHPRRHGKDESRVEGVELVGSWSRNFENSYVPSQYAPRIKF